MNKHLRFEAGLLRDSLKVFNRLLPSKSADIESRAITIDYMVEVGTARFRARSGSIVMQRVVPIVNTTSILTKEYTVDFHVLWSMLGVAMDDVVFEAKGKDLFMQTMGGAVELEFIHKQEVLDNPLLSIPLGFSHVFDSSNFATMLKDAAKAMTTAFRTQDKRLIFSNGKMSGNFMFILYRQKVPCLTNGSDIVFGLRGSDLVPLRLMMDSDTDVGCYTGNNVMCYCQGLNRVIVYNVPVHDLRNIDGLMDKHPSDISFTVNPDKLSRVLKVFKSVVGTTGPIRIEGDCSNVTIQAVNVSGKPVSFRLSEYDGLGFKTLVSASAFISSIGLLKKDLPTTMEIKRDRSVLISTGGLEILHACATFYDHSTPE